jgi:FixJ family two-component response regulator
LDDDKSVLNGLSRLLRAAGLQVQSFESCSSLLQNENLSSSRCLVMDVRMPGLSIEELIIELDKRGVNLPIIIISADDNDNTRLLARKIGAVGFFRKPVDGTALLDAIKWVSDPSKLET